MPGCRLPLFCMGPFLLALPLQAHAQSPEAIPPWGKELVSPAPVSVQQPQGENGGEPAPATESAEARSWSFWIQAEYLLWYTRNTQVPPLVTRGQTTVPRPGALDQAGTKFLYGGPIDFQDRNGARFMAGVCFGPEGVFGIEAGYFFLSARSVGTFLTSPGDPVLARPFFDVVNNREDSSLVSYPGVAHGAIDIQSTSFLHSAEANASAVIWHCDKNRITLLGGFRYLNLNEDLSISENVVGDAGALLFAGTNILVSDRFSTDNNFYGAQLGIRSEFHLWKLDVGIFGKVALGDSHEVSTVEGRTVANTAIPINAPAGLLALSSNSGTFTRDTFAVVPEFGVTVGLHVTERLMAYVGYTFVYWSDVARPADQVDRNLNPNLIPTSLTFGVPGGPARPSPGLRSTDFYAHGLTLGLTFRY
jgi:hypothetical protein